MKKLLTLFVFVLVMATGAFAQGNLQFNEAKYIELGMTLAPSVSYQFVEQTITVPSGKVWKLESATGTYVQNITPYPTYSPSIHIFLNRRMIFGTTTNPLIGNTFPIWLPAGAYTLRLAHTTSTSSSVHEIVGFVSAIEFNIVP